LAVLAEFGVIVASAQKFDQSEALNLQSGNRAGWSIPSHKQDRERAVGHEAGRAYSVLLVIVYSIVHQPRQEAMVRVGQVSENGFLTCQE